MNKFYKIIIYHIVFLSLLISSAQAANDEKIELLVNELMAIHGADSKKIDELYPDSIELKNLLMLIYKYPNRYYSHSNDAGFLRLLSENALRTYATVISNEKGKMSADDYGFFRKLIINSFRSNNLENRRFVYSVVRNLDSYEALDLLKMASSREKKSAMLEQLIEHSIQILTDYVPPKEGSNLHDYHVDNFQDRSAFYVREKEKWNEPINYFSKKTDEWFNGLPVEFQKNKTVLENYAIYKKTLENAKREFESYASIRNEDSDNSKGNLKRSVASNGLNSQKRRATNKREISSTNNDQVEKFDVNHFLPLSVILIFISLIFALVYFKNKNGKN